MKIKLFTRVFLLLYMVLLLIYLFNVSPQYIGECDDYSLPVASILNDFNFSISAEDVSFYNEIFPEWAENISNYSLSGYYTESGGELTWYFPLYAIVCIPAVLILKLLPVPAIKAFMITNCILLLSAIVITYKCLQASEKKKFFIVIALCINPVICYINWVSAEVMIYSCLIIAMVFWYNRWYKRAAVFVAVAAMLNPVILAVGLVMGIEYLIFVFKNIDKKSSSVLVIKKVLLYGCCYIPGIIPLVYNYIHTGFINLTASYDEYTVGTETTLQRFMAYIFDLNFGILPFFPVALVLGFVMLVIAVIKKEFRYVGVVVAFVLVTFLYSIMVHINSGMEGIARYSVWNTVLLIFAVFLFADKLIKNQKLLAVLLSLSIVFTGVSGLVYCNEGDDTNSMDPVAKFVLANVPGLYNPLPSTFNARVNGIDGGYRYDTPIIYSDDDGYIRKILATKNDAQELLLNCVSSEENDGWLENRISELDYEAEYISIPTRYKYIECYTYEPGQPILFFSENANYHNYIVDGLWNQEEWGTWTRGNKVSMRFKTNSSSSKLMGKIYCGIYNNFQRIKITVNGDEVYQGVATEEISFDFKNPGSGKIIDIELHLPDAVSPASLGESNDTREIALGIRGMLFED